MVLMPWMATNHASSVNPIRICWSRLGLALVALLWLLGPSSALMMGQDYTNAIGIPPFTQQLPVESGLHRRPIMATCIWRFHWVPSRKSGVSI